MYLMKNVVRWWLRLGKFYHVNYALYSYDKITLIEDPNICSARKLIDVEIRVQWLGHVDVK